MEAAIISACVASREAFDITAILEARADLTPNGLELYKQIESYYKRDSEATSVDTTILLKTIATKKPHSYEKLAAVLEDLPEASPANIVTLLTEQRLAHIGADLTVAIASGDFDKAATLSAQLSEVHELGVQSDEEGNDLFDVCRGKSVSDLTQKLRDGEGLNLLPTLLGDIVYNVMPGDHIIVFGQVNRGKSAVGIQAACDYAYEGKRVLFLGNEDPTDRMLLRIVCNLCGIPLEEVMEDEEYYTEVALENGYDNIIFKELTPGTMDDVEKLIAKFEPHVVIIDQARNIVPNGKQNSETAGQEAVMYQLRMVHKRYKTIGISMTQAGEKDLRGKPLEDKLKLEQNDVYGSKSGVASQADIMIGIGATKNMIGTGQLYLNVCKNKATGIHDGVMCFIDPFTSTIKSQ